MPPLPSPQTPGRNRRIPPVPLRPATSQEPTAYLAAPSFSSCTVPILLYSSWRGNFFHIFKGARQQLDMAHACRGGAASDSRCTQKLPKTVFATALLLLATRDADMGAQAYALLRRTPWRGHTKLVMVTPEGLPLTQPEAQLLPPLSRLSVQSLADFSARLPPGWPAAAPLDPSAPPPSFEGGEQRCFQTAFFCGRNFLMDTGLPPEEEAALGQAERQERLAEAVPQEPYSFGQAVSAFLQQRRGQQGQAGEPLAQDAISLQDAAAAWGQGRQRAATNGRLRIGLMKRGGEGRQLLNSEELLQSCNAWSYTPPGSSMPVTAECHEVGRGPSGCFLCCMRAGWETRPHAGTQTCTGTDHCRYADFGARPGLWRRSRSRSRRVCRHPRWVEAVGVWVAGQCRALLPIL